MLRLITIIILSLFVSLEMLAYTEDEIRQHYDRRRNEIQQKINDIEQTIRSEEAEIHNKKRNGESEESLEKQRYYISTLYRDLGIYRQQLSGLDDDMNREIQQTRNLEKQIKDAARKAKQQKQLEDKKRREAEEFQRKKAEAAEREAERAARKAEEDAEWERHLQELKEKREREYEQNKNNAYEEYDRKHYNGKIRTQQYLNSRQELTDEIAENVRAQVETSRDRGFKPVVKSNSEASRTSTVNKSKNQTSVKSLVKRFSTPDEEIGLEIGHPGEFISEAELRNNLHTRFFSHSSSAVRCKEPSILKRTWDFIDMDYVDYLNSGRGSLAEDVARKYYSEVRQITIDAFEKVKDVPQQFINFMNSDWGELYQTKRNETKSNVLDGIPSFITGKTVGDAKNVAKSIEVKEMIFDGNVNILKLLLSDDAPKVFVSVASDYERTNYILEDKVNEAEKSARGLAKKVIEKETDIELPNIPVNEKEALKILYKESKLPPPEKYIKIKIGGSFKTKLKAHSKEAFPELVEHYETFKMILK